MVRALAGDSTMTRFFDTAGSVAPGPARTIDADPSRRPGRRARPKGATQTSRIRRRKSSSISRSSSVSTEAPRRSGTGTGRGDRDGASAGPVRERLRRSGGISTNRMCEVREEEHRVDVVGEDRSLPVEHAQVRAAQPDVARRRQAEQVGDQRLFVVEVQDGITDHAPIVHGPGVRRKWPDGPGLRVVEVDDQADAPARHPHADPDPVVGCSSGSRSDRPAGSTTARSGSTGGCPGPRRTDRPTGSRGSPPSV